MSILNRILSLVGLRLVAVPKPRGVFLVDRAGRCFFQP